MLSVGGSLLSYLNGWFFRGKITKMECPELSWLWKKHLSSSERRTLEQMSDSFRALYSAADWGSTWVFIRSWQYPCELWSSFHQAACHQIAFTHFMEPYSLTVTIGWTRRALPIRSEPPALLYSLMLLSLQSLGACSSVKYPAWHFQSQDQMMVLANVSCWIAVGQSYFQWSHFVFYSSSSSPLNCPLWFRF